MTLDDLARLQAEAKGEEGSKVGRVLYEDFIDAAYDKADFAALAAERRELLEALRNLVAAASLSAARAKPFAWDSPAIVAANAIIAKAEGEA